MEGQVEQLRAEGVDYDTAQRTKRWVRAEFLLNIEQVLLTVLPIVFLSSFVRSAFGFGDALIAMPMLVIFIGIDEATPLVALISYTIAMLVLIKNWAHADLKNVWQLARSSIVGIPLGVILLKSAHDGIVKMILAVIIITFSLYKIVKPSFTLKNSRKKTFLFGFVAGILGGAYNMNGLAIAIYGTLNHWGPYMFRATLQGYFLSTGFFILATHGISGLWTANVFYLYLLSLPIVFLAIIMGHFTNRYLPPGRFDIYVHMLLIAIGVILLADSI
jgi:uncharacterized membrane protein YfcA